MRLWHDLRMPDANYDSPDQLLAEARSLVALPAGSVESRLEMLRLCYRETPFLFTQEILELLRQAGERAKQARSVDYGGRALASLKAVFGDPTVRAGQLEIHPGRDGRAGLPWGDADRGREVSDVPDPGASHGRGDAGRLAADFAYEGPGRRDE